MIFPRKKIMLLQKAVIRSGYQTVKRKTKLKVELNENYLKFEIIFPLKKQKVTKYPRKRMNQSQLRKTITVTLLLTIQLY